MVWNEKTCIHIFDQTGTSSLHVCDYSPLNSLNFIFLNQEMETKVPLLIGKINCSGAG